ncbi:MAG: hypothetical protein CAPSK01_000533 [Candidatus Accumulibacter vicinus]|uniref:Uncharacterized protein n=1 Tax=Candidatus Accumulibacter vicinus TaxID=2954382 RepID=A0A084Y526_9PROT|nr:MAG: hypothetical protein CAPSK01_000533 [Candidatus Accumulibacter vicinus]
MHRFELRAVGGVFQVAAFQAAAVAQFERCERAGGVFLPVPDGRLDDLVGTRDDVRRAMPVDDLAAQLGVLPRRRVIAEEADQNHAVATVTEGRQAGIAVLDAGDGHFGRDQRQPGGAELVDRRHEPREEPQFQQRILLAHFRPVDQRGDGALAEVFADACPPGLPMPLVGQRRKVDAEQAQRFEAGIHRFLQARLGQTAADQDFVDPDAIGDRCRRGHGLATELFHFGEATEQESGLGGAEKECAAARTAVLPVLLGQQRDALPVVDQRGFVGGRALGLFAGGLRQVGETVALVALDDQRKAVSDLVGGVEEPVVRGFASGRQGARNLQVILLPARFRSQRIEGLLDAVVREAVVAGLLVQPAVVHGLAQALAQVGRILPEQLAERRRIDATAEAGGEGEKLRQVRRQVAANLLDQQIDDVVGDFEGVDARRVQSPGAARSVEVPVVAFFEQTEKLVHEERVAGRLRVHDGGQGASVGRRLAQRVADQRFDLVPLQVAHAQTAHELRRSIEFGDRHRERAGRADFIAAVSADEQRMAQRRVAQQALQQVERSRVDPVQVVEKNDQRVPGVRQRADEAPQDVSEAIDRLLAIQIGQRRLCADDQFEMGKQVGHHPPVRRQGRAQRLPPRRQFLFRVAQQPRDKAVERLYPAGERNVAAVLLELAFEKETVPFADRPVHLAHQRRLADAGRTGNQEQRPGAFGDAFEGRLQGRDVVPAAVELLGNPDLGRRVAEAQREVVDGLPVPPFRGAALEIVAQPGGRLVALCGRLAHQLADDPGDRRRERRVQRARIGRLERQVGVDDFQRVVRDEG